MAERNNSRQHDKGPLLGLEAYHARQQPEEGEGDNITPAPVTEIQLPADNIVITGSTRAVITGERKMTEEEKVAVYSQYVEDMTLTNAMAMNSGGRKIPIRPRESIPHLRCTTPPPPPRKQLFPAPAPQESIHSSARLRGRLVDNRVEKPAESNRVSAFDRLGNQNNALAIRDRQPSPPKDKQLARVEAPRQQGRTEFVQEESQTAESKRRDQSPPQTTKKMIITKKGRSPSEFEILRKRMEELEKLSHSRKETPGSAMDALAQHILDNLPEKKINPPTDPYYGNTCPNDWLSSFEGRVMLATQNTNAWCVAFVGCMRERAASWLRSMPKGSITGWTQLRASFLSDFEKAERPKKTKEDLRAVLQKKGESTRSYVDRFIEVYDLTRNIPDAEVRSFFTNGMMKGTTLQTFSMIETKSLSEMFAQAIKLSLAEPDPVVTIYERRPQSYRGYEKQEEAPRDRDVRQDRRQDYSPERRSRGGQREAKRPFMIGDPEIPLNARVSAILAEIKHQLPKAPPLRTPTNQRNPKKYCEYHEDHGHHTDDCWALRSLIQEMLKEGKIQKFRADREERESEQKSDYHRSGRQRLDVIREDAPSNAQIKRQINIMNIRCYDKPITIAPGENAITFTKSELIPIEDPIMDLPLIIICGIGNWDVERVMIDTGAARDIIYWDCLQKLDYGTARLTPYIGVLHAFSNDPVTVKGTIRLPVSIGDYAIKRTEEITFLVVDLPSPYNMILGTPAMRQFEMVPSIPHQRAKFPAGGEIGIARSRPRAYLRYLQKKQDASPSTSIQEIREGEKNAKEQD